MNEMRIATNLKTANFIALVAVKIIILFFFTLTGCNNDQQKDPLTQEEREWLSKNNGKIILSHDPDANPIDYIDENGKFLGLAADYVKLVEEKLNFKFKILSITPWSEVVKKAQNREIDVLCAFSKSPEREEWMLFTDPYIEIKVVILTRNDLEGRLTLEKMKNIRVSFTEGWVVDYYLNDYKGHLQKVPAVDPKTAMNYLTTGHVDAWVTALTIATKQIEDNRVTNLRIAGETDLSFKLSMASRKDWPILNQILKKGLGLITEKEKKDIFNKWIHIKTKDRISKEELIGFIIVLLIIFIFIAFIIIGNRALKIQVESRTAELRKELEERKRLEKKAYEAKQFLDNISDIAYQADLEGNIVYVNSAVEKIIGISTKNIIGKPFVPLFVKQDHASLIDVYKRTLAGKILENTLTFKNGATCHFTSIPRYDSNGNIIGTFGIARDITEKIKTDEKIKRSLKEKEVLLKEVHHRVKNNMNLISSLLGLQKFKVKDPILKDILNNSMNRIKSMSLVHEEIYKSKNLAEINVKKHVEHLANNIFNNYVIDTKRIKLINEIDNISFSIEKMIPIGLIVNELITNTVKHGFAKKDKGQIYLSIKKTDQNKMLFRYYDAGQGFPKDFDFENIDSLGLNLIKNLAEQIDGILKIQTNERTEFEIRFSI